VRLLTLRPAGTHAAAARKRAGTLGTLAVSPSFPCERLLVNAAPYATRGELGVKVLLPPGEHRVACLLPKVHYAEERVFTVAANGLTVIAFSFAIFANQLDPWGRLLVDVPAAPASAPATAPATAPTTEPARVDAPLVDLGPFPEIAVPLPLEGREVRLVRRSGDGERTRESRMVLLPGQKYILRW
jgi:hypothetical protein